MIKTQSPYLQDSDEEILHHCFDNTTLSYKFYWFMSIIEKVAVEGIIDFPAIDVAVDMVSMAWTPISKNKLGLGKYDNFKQIIPELQSFLHLPTDSMYLTIKSSIFSQLHDEYHQRVSALLKKMIVYVPFCFLQPWTHLSYDKCKKEVIERNHFDTERTPYWLYYDQKKVLHIHVREYWAEYFKQHAQQLFSFAMAALQQYAQKYNTGVQSIQYTLDWRQDPLVHNHQLEYWNKISKISIDQGHPLLCLFTHQIIKPDQYRIDHFLPNQIDQHYQLWSLYPSDVSANINPSGNRYNESHYMMRPLAKGHRQALITFLDAGGDPKFLQPDFSEWNIDIQDLATMNEENFIERYTSHFQTIASQYLNRVTGFKDFTSSSVHDDTTLSKVVIDKNYGPIHGVSNIYK